MAPVWISHRGDKADAPENTLAAFRAAVALGFPVLETDLRITADDHIVLFHDPDLRRLTGSPRRVADATRSELSRIELPGGHRLLFLDEFVAAFPERGYVFDVKPETGPRTVARFVAWTNETGVTASLRRRARFVFWAAAHQQALLDRWPDAACYARAGECWRAGLAVIAGLASLGGIRRGTTYALPPRLAGIELFTPAKIEAFHRQGARVLAFLPATDRDTLQAIASGVDEILTNGRVLAASAEESALL